MPRNIALFLFVIALLSGLTVHAQPINWDSVRAEYVKKYQPLIMPKWLFPIIVERNDGMRDTLYLGYHPDAKGTFGGADTVYGERGEMFNPIAFYGRWTSGSIVDSQIYKAQITTLPASKAFFGAMELQHDYYPLKVFFDISTLYDTALPFPDTIAPIGLGAIDCYDDDAFNCALFWTPYWLTDDPIGYYQGSHPPCNYTPSTMKGQSPCRATDSIVLYGNSTWGIGVLLFRIMAYMDYATMIDDITDDNSLFEVFPNPAMDYLYINNKAPLPVTVSLLTLNGSIVYKGNTEGNTVLPVSVAHLPAGLYLLSAVAQSGAVSHTKIIIAK